MTRWTWLGLLILVAIAILLNACWDVNGYRHGGELPGSGSPRCIGKC